MNNSVINVAIDGPGGAGKSTSARAAAKEMGYIYVDTGALYRAVGVNALRKNIDTKDKEAVAASLEGISVDLVFENGEQKVLLNGENVSVEIRTPPASMAASDVSAVPEVRAFLFDLQRDIASRNNCIMDGRDIGTVILPNATVKFFMNASDEAKAKRRYEELLAKGENITLEEVAKTMAERDRNDSTRKIAPAVPAPDAIMLDNSETLEKTLETAINIIMEKVK